jgi:hypothetical protein
VAPLGFERAVKQCLAKDPDERWQSAGDLRSELRWIAESSSQTEVPVTVAARPVRRPLIGWTLAAVFAGLLSLRGVFVTDDLRSYAYTAYHQVSSLFVSEARPTRP